MKPGGIIDEVKSRLDIVDIVSERVSLKKTGANYRGLCPFHGEKTASFTVSPEKQIFHCFGCGAGGDIFGFVMKFENIEFDEALQRLSERAGVQYRGGRDKAKSGKIDRLRELLSRAADFFEDTLQNTSEALEYFARREIAEKTIAEFSLGYAPGGWSTLSNHLLSKGFTEEEILASGMARKGKHGLYDFFRNRVMFPITDERGRITAFGGRVLDSSEEPKYLNLSDTILFNKSATLFGLSAGREAIRKEGLAVLCEGYLDVISAHQAGLCHFTAPLGTALTERHAGLLKRFTENLTLVFDGDQAGISAARRSLSTAITAGLTTRVLVLPGGQDPDDIIRLEGGRAFGLMLENDALTPMEFMVRTGGEDKRKKTWEALEVVMLLKDPIVRDTYITELSDLTGIREAALLEGLEIQRKKGGSYRGGSPDGGARGKAGQSPKEASVRQQSPASPDDKAFLMILSVIVNCPFLTEDAAEALGEAGLLEMLKESQAPYGGLILMALEKGPEEFSAVQDESVRGLISGLQLRPGFDPGQEGPQVLYDCVLRLKLRSLEEQIRQADKTGDYRLSKRLHDEKLKLRKLYEEKTHEGRV